MLQRYDIAMNDKTNRLSIKEFVVLETEFRNRNNYKRIKRNYSLIHEVLYDGEMIREAINKG